MTQDQSPAPAPVARKRRTETLMHGVVLTDDYAWLRDKQDPEVTAYLEAENAHAEAWMAPLAALREDLYKEMLSHIKQTDVSVPFRDGDWWYYTRTEEGQQYAISCRKAATDRITPSDCHPERGRGGDRVEGPAFSFLDDTPEQVILDGNQLAEGHAFFAIGATDITDDGRWLAYTTDTTGFRQYTLHIKDLGTGETLPGEVRARRLRRLGRRQSHSLLHRRRRRAEAPVPAMARTRAALRTPKTCWSIRKTTSASTWARAAPATANSSCWNRPATSPPSRWVLPAADPKAAFTLISPRQDEHEYSIDHRNGLWFIRTNDRGRNFRLVTAPVATPGREHWTELIPHRDDVMLEDVDLFAGFFVACEREDGLPRLRLWRFTGDGPEAAPAGEIAFPEPAYSAHPHINRIFDTTTFRYAYQSLVTPSSVYEYDVATGASTLLKQLEIPGGFDRTLYASERVHATAPDGVKVPVSLVYRKDKRAAGQQSPLRLRLRLLWLLAAPRLQLQSPQPARSRRSHGLRAHPRRRRPGRALARRRKNASSSATPSLTSSPPSSTSPLPATATPVA